MIADSANRLAISRDAWIEVASRVPVRAVEIEVVCSDTNERRHRLSVKQNVKMLRGAIRGK